MPARGRPRSYATVQARQLARQESQRRYNLARRHLVHPSSETVNSPANISSPVSDPATFSITPESAVSSIRPHIDNFVPSLHDDSILLPPTRENSELASESSPLVEGSSSPSLPSYHGSTINPVSIHEMFPVSSNSPTNYSLTRYLECNEEPSSMDPELYNLNTISAERNISVSPSHTVFTDPDQVYTVSNMATNRETNSNSPVQSHISSCMITEIRSISCTSHLTIGSSSESDPRYYPTDSNPEDTLSDPGSVLLDSTTSQGQPTSAESSSRPLHNSGRVDLIYLLNGFRTNRVLQKDSDNMFSDTDWPDEHASQRSILARFLLSHMLQFPGCGTQPHPVSTPELTIESGQALPIHQAESRINFLRPKQCQSVLAAVTDIPDVLNHDAFFKSRSYFLTSGTADLIYSGIRSIQGVRHAEGISFSKRETRLQRKSTPSISYDIDSVLAFPNCLSFAKTGVKIAFSPGRFTNIQADLHIRIPLGSLPDLPVNINSAKISQIPHFQLGHVASAEDLQLFLLFPYLMEIKRPTNYLRDSQLARFIDDILLPSISKHCPSSLIQHIPGSFEMAQLNSLASGLEPATRSSPTTGRTQLFRYYIPHQYLRQIWNTIQEYGHLPGNHDLSHCILFVNAKNLKLITMSSSLDQAIARFQTMWNTTCDFKRFNRDRFWVDIASEVIHQPGRETTDRHSRCDPHMPPFQQSGTDKDDFTFMWRTCCLKSYEMEFSNLFSHDRYKADFYQWALTKDAVNMTLTPGRTHIARLSGLAYSQFYSTTKEIFDAGKIYPFQNTALEGLAVDSKLNHTWREIGGPTHWNSHTLSQAYLASKRRAEAALAASTEKSYGTRQEHRLDMLLLNEIIRQDKLSCLSPPDYPTSLFTNTDVHPPYIIALTSEITLFLHSNINKFCFGFEYILNLSRDQRIDWEHTRVMVMFLRLLKGCYSGIDLSRYPELSAASYTNPHNNMIHHGLNIQETISQRGYGYLPTDLMDWKSCLFRDDKAPLVGFSSPHLERIFRKGATEISMATNHFHLFTRILTHIGTYKEDYLFVRIACQILSCSLIEIFRGDLWSALLGDKITTVPEYSSLLEPAASLCILNLQKLFHADLADFKFITNYNRHKFHPFERVSYLWDYDTARKRKTWENKEWRTLFQLVCDRLGQYYPQSYTQKTFRNTHFHRFLQHNLVFPQPVNGVFHQKVKSKDDIQQRVWFCAFHAGTDFQWNTNEWSCGSPTPGFFNAIVPPPLPYSIRDLSELAACVDMNGVSRTKLQHLASSNHNLEYEDGHIVPI